MTCAALVGKALGIELPFTFMLAVLPLVLLAGAVPITFQGIGVMEWLTLQLLFDPAQPGLATANQLVGMLVLFRLCMLAYAMLGSLVLLRGDIHLFPEKTNAKTSPPSWPTSPTSQRPGPGFTRPTSQANKRVGRTEWAKTAECIVRSRRIAARRPKVRDLMVAPGD